MTPNSVSALAYRAREGLRQAFLQMHAGDLVSEACRDTNDLLGGYVRGALSRRDSAKVDEHLERCRRCTAVYLELTEVNSSLAGLLGPAVLGSAAAAYLGTGTATGVGAGTLLLLGRGKDAVLSHVSATTAAAAVVGVGVAGISAIAIFNRGPEGQTASAQPPELAQVLPSSQPEPDSRTAHKDNPRDRPRDRGASTNTPPGAVLPSPDADSPASTSEASTSTSQQDDPQDTQTGNQSGTGTTPPGTDTPGTDAPGTDTPGTPGTDPGSGTSTPCLLYTSDAADDLL